MTTILNKKKELKEKVALYTKEQFDADVSIFELQKEALQKILNTDWFKNIRDFWLKQEMTAIKEFETVDPENKYEVAKIQAKFGMASKFNSYLNVRLN